MLYSLDKERCEVVDVDVSRRLCSTKPVLVPKLRCRLAYGDSHITKNGCNTAMLVQRIPQHRLAVSNRPQKRKIVITQNLSRIRPFLHRPRYYVLAFVQGVVLYRKWCTIKNFWWRETFLLFSCRSALCTTSCSPSSLQASPIAHTLFAQP